MNDGVFNTLIAQLRGQLDQLSGTQLRALRALLEPASMLATCRELIEQFGRTCRDCPPASICRITWAGGTAWTVNAGRFQPSALLQRCGAAAQVEDDLAKLTKARVTAPHLLPALSERSDPAMAWSPTCR